MLTYPLRCENARPSVIRSTAKLQQIRSLRSGIRDYDLLKKSLKRARAREGAVATQRIVVNGTRDLALGPK